MNAKLTAGRSISVLVTGKFEHWEFCDCIFALNDLANCRTVEETSIEQLGDVIDSFDAVIAFQTRPGELGHDLFRYLQTNAPLSPIVMVLGSWCEGEMRSGYPPEGVIRYYWHQFESHWRDFASSLINDVTTSWHLPATMTHADRLLERPPVQSEEPINIAVVARQPWNAEAICDACNAIGYRAEILKDLQQPDPDCQVVVYDDDGFSTNTFEEINKYSIPTVVTSGYPRKFEIQQLFPRAAIVSKPFGLVELRHAIESANMVHSMTENIIMDDIKGGSY